jgi:hypothetical protein
VLAETSNEDEEENEEAQDSRREGMSVSEFVGEAPASADSAYEEHGSLASIDTYSGTALAGTDARY